MTAWIVMAKEMALAAGLQAAITALTVIGRTLGLSEAERRAVVARVEQGLLGDAAAGGP